MGVGLEKRDFAGYMRTGARLAGAVTIILGALALVGWMFDIPLLRSDFMGVMLKANGALAFALSGLSLLLLTANHHRPHWIGVGLAAVVLLIGGLTFGQYMFEVNLGVDELLFRDASAGRMPESSALNFTLIGAALLLLASGCPRLYGAGQVLAVVAGIIALIALLGYLYGAPAFYQLFFYETMPLRSALGFVLLSLGVFCAQPGWGLARLFILDGPGGMMARRLLPLVVVLPVAISWIIVTGLRLGLVDALLATELFVILSIIVFLIIIWWNALVIQRVEEGRLLAEANLVKANRAYRTLSACNQILVRAGSEADLLRDVCSSITQVGGYRMARIALEGAPEPFVCAQPDVSEAALPPVAHTDYPHIIERMHTRPEWQDSAARLGIDSLLALPIRDDSRVFGTLQVCSADPTFDREEIELLVELAGDVGYGVVTLRTRAARRAAEERSRYQASLLENVSDAVIATDLNFTIQSWNRAAEQIYGWRAGEVMGRNAREVLRSRIIGDAVDSTLEKLRKEGVWRGEAIQLRRDDTPVIVASSVSFILDAENRPAGIVAVNRDITELKRASEAVREAEARQAALERERQLVALRENFINTVTHDFRNPLSVILASSDILTHYRDRMDDERRDEHIARIHEQALFMKRLMESVLDLARVRAGRLDFQPRPLDLEAVCRKLLAQVDDGQHTFVFSAGGNLRGAVMDAAILQRVLLNLLSNAVKYSPEGSEIRLEVERQGSDVVFRVVDHGIGIPKDVQAHIFEPFTRADNTGSVSGTGLGLAIVRENVELHRGTLALESEEGQGTTVTVRLPHNPKNNPEFYP